MKIYKTIILICMLLLVSCVKQDSGPSSGSDMLLGLG